MNEQNDPLQLKELKFNSKLEYDTLILTNEPGGVMNHNSMIEPAENTQTLEEDTGHYHILVNNCPLDIEDTQLDEDRLALKLKNLDLEPCLNHIEGNNSYFRNFYIAASICTFAMGWNTYNLGFFTTLPDFWCK